MKNSSSFKRLFQVLLPLFLFCSLTANAQCVQGNGGDFDWGYDISSDAPKIADDFLVEPNKVYGIMDLDLYIFTDQMPGSLNISFYEDNDGKPGELIQTVIDAEVLSSEEVGSVNGHPLYKVNVFLYNEFIFFSGGATGARYWMQPEAISFGEPVYWGYTIEGSLGEPVHRMNSNGEWTIPNSSAQAVFEMRCSHNDFNCFFEVEEEILPITHVKFAGLDNYSDSESDKTVDDFTHMRVYVSPGEQYEVILEGNSGGNFTDYYTALIGIYSIDEPFDFIAYEIGTITNSDGEDEQQTTAVITIPEDLPEGRYRLRFIKERGEYADGFCTRISYGQAEDYELIVSEDSNQEDFCFIHYPEESWYMFDFDIYDRWVAADFHVDNDMLVKSVTFSVFEYPDGTFFLSFYQDNNGTPGDVIMPAVEITPSMIIPKQWLFESPMLIYYVTLKLPEPLIFDSGNNYWMGISTQAFGGNYAGSALNVNNGTRAYYSEDNGSSWNEYEYENDLFFVVEGECGELGVNDFATSDFEFYPNPVNDILNFKTSKSIEKVEVYNSAGQKVSNMNFNKSENNLNMSHLSAGVYIIRVILNDGSVETFKIIKQ